MDSQEEINLKANLMNITKSFNDNDLFIHQDLKEQTIKKSINDKYRGNNVNSVDSTSKSFTNEIEPRFDFERLYELCSISDALSTSIDAYATNICGFGYELVPEIDIINIKGKKLYREDKKPVEESIIKEMELEESKIKSFFDSLSLDNTWLELQVLKRKILESTGNAYYEYERDNENNIIGVSLLETNSIRITKRESTGILIKQLIKDSKTLEYKVIDRFKRFRKFVQLATESKKIYFKEFNDPRVMNALDGEYLKDLDGNYLTFDKTKEIQESINRLNKEFKIATEIYHYKIADISQLDSYGVPRYIPLTPILLGVRSSDLINLNLLKNKGIPDLILICEGAKAGTLKKQIEDQIRENKDLGKFGSLLVVEGDQNQTGQPGTNLKFNNPSIRVQPLAELLTKEGMFITFSDKVAERVFSLFRLPNLLVGRTNNVNRATAEVAKEICQEQVFSPEQEKEDSIINNFLFPSLGIKYFKYKSKTSQIKNTESIADITNKFMNNGALTPRDGRDIVSQLLNKDFEDINEPYMDKPLSVYLKESSNNVNNDFSKNTTDNTNNGMDNISNSNKNTEQNKMIELQKSEHSALYNLVEKSLKDVGIETKRAYLYINGN